MRSSIFHPDIDFEDDCLPNPVNILVGELLIVIVLKQVYEKNFIVPGSYSLEKPNRS